MDRHESKGVVSQFFRTWKTVEDYQAEILKRRADYQSRQHSDDRNRRAEFSRNEGVFKRARVLRMLRQARKENRWIEITEFRDAGIFDFRSPIAAFRHRGFGIANKVRRNRRAHVESRYWMTFDLERDGQ